MAKNALCQIGHLEEGDPQELGMLMGERGRRYSLPLHVNVKPQSAKACGTRRIN